MTRKAPLPLLEKDNRDIDWSTAAEADDWVRLTPNLPLSSLWEKSWDTDRNTAARRPRRDNPAYPTPMQRLSPLWEKNWDTVLGTVPDIVPDTVRNTAARRPALDVLASTQNPRLSPLWEKSWGTVLDTGQDSAAKEMGVC